MRSNETLRKVICANWSWWPLSLSGVLADCCPLSASVLSRPCEHASHSPANMHLTLWRGFIHSCRLECKLINLSLVISSQGHVLRQSP